MRTIALVALTAVAAELVLAYCWLTFGPFPE